MSKAAKKYVGKEYGLLTVKAYIPGKGGIIKTPATAICQCTCGTITEPIQIDNLASGNTKSCGHRRREVTIARSTTHGLSSRDRLMTLNDETRTAREWAEHLNWPLATIITRVFKLGWTDEQALTVPPIVYKKPTDSE